MSRKWPLYVALLNFFQVFSQDVLLVNQTSVIPCDEGWIHFGQKCYKLRGNDRNDGKSWTDAAYQCEHVDGGHLVSIHSKEEHDFLVLFLLPDIQSDVWIGLNDRLEESEYVWHDGSPVNFTEWYLNEPSGVTVTYGDEDCVEIRFFFMYFKYVDGIAKWNDARCEKRQAYICQKEADPERLSPNPLSCSSNEGGGWKFQESCYHAVTERQTWDEAEEHCKKKFNGHLVTVSDTMVDLFLDRVLSSFGKDIWIGLKIRNQFQQKWVSGWHVSYDGGLSERPNKIENGLCVFRRGRKMWMMAPCSEAHSFVCETSKAVLPVLKPAVPGSHCPTDFDEWRDLDGESCYYIVIEKKVNWHQAQFECDKIGGNLVSIHSQVEQDILRPFVRYTQGGIYIGLIRALSNRKKFAWVDGTPLDFMKWKVEQPDDYGRSEECVEVLVTDMKWNDCDCDIPKRYMCSVKKISPDASLNKTTGQLSFGPSSGLVAASVILAFVLLGVFTFFVFVVCKKCIPHKRFSPRPTSLAKINLKTPINIYESYS